ncbi:MAG: acyltransferase family protein [Solirubrobacteraceae bacterium]
MGSGAAKPRLSAIDIIKGLAIVSVICLHTLSTNTLYAIAALFHIWQAVPVFIFLMGRNAASSLERRGSRSVRELYSRQYLASRIDRIYVPFLVAFAASVLLTVLTHTAHDHARTIAGGLLVGMLPIAGPGNYFITLVFQFALVFPLVFRGLQRWPVATLLLCLAINVTFDLYARRIGVIRDHPYIYEVCLAQYVLLVALGGLLARIPARRLLTARWLWVGALVGAAYLGLNSIDNSNGLFGGSNWAFASVFYTVFIVVLGMGSLPSREHGWLSKGLVELGRASYHVFLVQIIWFGLAVWTPGSVPVLLGNLAVTLAAGVVFFRAMARMPLPTAAGLLARRHAALDVAAP